MSEKTALFRQDEGWLSEEVCANDYDGKIVTLTRGMKITVEGLGKEKGQVKIDADGQTYIISGEELLKVWSDEEIPLAGQGTKPQPEPEPGAEKKERPPLEQPAMTVPTKGGAPNYLTAGKERSMVNGTKVQLIEKFPGAAHLVEAQDGIVYFSGLCQKVDTWNANTRLYPRSIFERVLKNETGFMTRMKNREVLGQLEHPEGGKGTSLKEASHVMVGLKMEGNDLIGKWEVLPTPNGHILEALLRRKIPVGVSSRGDGSTEQGEFGGKLGDIVQEDYELSTFDTVAEPSTAGAFAAIVESVMREEASKNDAAQTGKEKVVPETTAVTEEKVKEVAQAAVAAALSEKEKQEQEESRKALLLEKKRTAAERVAGYIAKLEKDLDEAGKATAGTEKLQERLATAEELIQRMAERLAEAKDSKGAAETQKKLDAAIKLSEGLVTRIHKGSLLSFKKQWRQKHPALAESKAFMEAKTIEEAKAVVEGFLARPTSDGRPAHVPPSSSRKETESRGVRITRPLGERIGQRGILRGLLEGME